MPVRLSDAYIHDVYESYTALNNPENSQFVASGVIATSPLMNEIAKVGGKNATMPFWQDLDPTVEPNYSNDDPSDLAVANKIGSGSMTARKSWLNQGYSDMDLVQELAGSSPMSQIKNRFGVYWTRQMERRVIASCVGVMADNVANDSGDMVVDISGNSGSDAVFGSDAFIDAAYTMGDNADSIKAIAIHSSIMARLVKNDEIVTIQDSNGNITLQSYKGRRVIVDDNLPVASSVYTSILFGTGAFGFGTQGGNTFALGEGTPRVDSEVWRQPQAGAGGGLEEIWERKTWIIHPQGFSFVEGTLAEQSPTLADLRLAAHWNRIAARKQIPLAFIKAKAS